MKRPAGGHLRLLTGVAALWSACGPIRSVAQEPLWGGRLIDKVDSLAEATFSEGLVSGLSVGVKRGDQLLFVRGYGFADLEDELVNAAYLSMTHPGAAGALCSTVLDLLSWSAALREGRLISGVGYEEMVSVYRCVPVDHQRCRTLRGTRAR